MQEFTVTTHAKKRMKERNVPYPKKNSLKPLGRKTRKKVRDSCKSMGHDTRNFVYYMKEVVCDNSKYLAVYVCKQIEIGLFNVITVLTYPLKNQN